MGKVFKLQVVKLAESLLTASGGSLESLGTFGWCFYNSRMFAKRYDGHNMI